MKASADEFHRAIERLRSPYLCNWDTSVARTLADWLDAALVGGPGPNAIRMVHALNTTFGDPQPQPWQVRAQATGGGPCCRHTGMDQTPCQPKEETL